jgi:type IV pilus assembly protein PilW
MTARFCRLPTARPQRGVTLLELMVGLTIGLVVSTAAVGTLVFMQSSSRLTGEASRMQQDATLAFNLMGQYIRAAGSVNLTASPSGGVQLTPLTSFNGVNNNSIQLDGLSATEFRSAISLLDSAGINGPQFDCLGRQVTGPILITHFDWNGQDLRCVGLQQGETIGTGGAGVSRQPIIGNVAQFVVRYGLRAPTGNIQYQNFAPTLNWGNLAAVRVCLVLTSQGPVEDFHALYRDTPGLPFNDCGAGTINRATVVADPQRRLYRTYQQVFTLRPNNT